MQPARALCGCSARLASCPPASRQLSHPSFAWRLVFGAIDMYQYSEVTMTINFPRWTTFPVSVALLAFLVIVIAYTVARSIAEFRAGRFFSE